MGSGGDDGDVGDEFDQVSYFQFLVASERGDDLLTEPMLARLRAFEADFLALPSVKSFCALADPDSGDGVCAGFGSPLKLLYAKPQTAPHYMDVELPLPAEVDGVELTQQTLDVIMAVVRAQCPEGFPAGTSCPSDRLPPTTLGGVLTEMIEDPSLHGEVWAGLGPLIAMDGSCAELTIRDGKPYAVGCGPIASCCTCDDDGGGSSNGGQCIPLGTLCNVSADQTEVSYSNVYSTNLSATPRLDAATRASLEADANCSGADIRSMLPVSYRTGASDGKLTHMRGFMSCGVYTTAEEREAAEEDGGEALWAAYDAGRRA